MKRNALQFNLGRYKERLAAFESRYEMESNDFAAKFNAGELGDEADWFEWQYAELQDEANLPWLLSQGWIVYRTDAQWNADSGLWETYKWWLKRQVLKPEAALDDLTESFTNAYNEGRTLNDQRYDEIVALFSVMLDKTEDSLVSLESADDTYESLIELLIYNVSADYTTHADDVDGALDDWADSERTRIEVT